MRESLTLPLMECSYGSFQEQQDPIANKLVLISVLNPVLSRFRDFLIFQTKCKASLACWAHQGSLGHNLTLPIVFCILMSEIEADFVILNRLVESQRREAD